MRGTYSFGKRLMAMLLCVAMIAAYFPGMALSASAAQTGNKVVDPSTIHGWKQYFGADVMSTEYTGGVWTDKTVFNSFSDYQTDAGVGSFVNPAGNGIPDAVKQLLATDPENFLIALSAITANKSVSGSASAPMDTMLVLDVSGSMQGDNAVAMVQATNQAIETLLKQNTNNRVGVVLYSGNHNFGNSNTATASVILPLGRYSTTNTQNVTVNGQTQRIPAYLTISGSGDGQTVSVASSVNNGSSTDSKTVRGGTYIQNGLYRAWQQFNAVTDTVVPEGSVQAGTQRTPVIILMSDGAPTAATTSYNNVNTSNLGDGGNTSNRYSFLTQLTASWVRSKVQAKYNNTAPKFYTLGIGTGNSSEATSVLNPAGSNNTINGYWENFLDGSNGQNVQIVSGRNGWSVYKDAAVTAKNYVDQYWLANNASGLINAFDQIVKTIVLESERHSTLVDEDGADLSGYVTFEDELGELMEVKAVKGLTIGNVIFTGAELAKGFDPKNADIMGTMDEPTEYGDEFIRTVRERLGITDTAVAQQLAANAYNAGQLSYTSDTQYSNYIGWYADADGNYLGFWQESDGYGADAAPEGAAYINKSYGYLGAQSTDEHASDMMHVVVMVHTEIATGHQSVVYKIPASLIPSVTYHVELNGSDPSDVKSITRDAAEPIRLLVEVGLREEINSVNLEAKIAEHIAKGGHVHENTDGTYTFYTNRWGDGDGGEVDYNEPLTHLVTESHFHPALENERYYHVVATRIYSDNAGTVYTGTSAPSGDGYYYTRTYYETVNGTPKQITEYVPLAAVSVAKAVQGDDGWYVPAGTPHQLSRFAAAKTPGNATGTLAYSWNPVVLHDENGYNSYAFLGNNGSVTVEPAQGIALSKTVAETVEGAPTEFTFTVELSQAVASPVITDADGNALAGIATVSGNVITVKVSAGQTVYITGIPTGTAYTVKEVADRYYTASSSNASGTVTAYTITPVDFVNVPRVYNDLIVSKDVLHPGWMTDVTALEAQEFSVKVTITGADPNTTYSTSNASVSFTTDANGTATQTIQLKDAQSLTVYDLPVGTAYTVAEVNVPNGHTANATESAPITGTVSADGDAVAGVTNTYEPDPAETTLTVTGTKTFLTSGGYTVPDADWPSEGFTVELYSVDFATGVETLLKGDIVATAANKTWSADVALTFPQTGVYHYKIVEKVGSRSDIVYDGTSGLFEIVVVDDASGNLKVGSVVPIQQTVGVTSGTNGYAVDKDFTNYKDAGSVRIPVQKIISGSDTIPASDFVFELRDSQGGLVSTINGNGSFVIAGYAEDFAEAQSYTIREYMPELVDRIVGMTYDSTVYSVSVQWVDNASGGGLVATVAGTQNNVATFTNTYAPTVSSPEIVLSGDKTITGDRSAFLNGESYTFALYQTDADFAVSGTPVQTDTVSGSDYSYRFDGLTFDKEGVYYFVVKEASGTQGGVTYDASEYHVIIHVVKAIGANNATILEATASVVKFGTTDSVATDALDFVNTYTVSGTAETVISGMKYLEGRELIADEFEFGLYQDGTLVQSVKNLTNGSFAFEPIVYTPDDIGEHTYTVKEIANGLGGVTYDTETAYTVVVTVSDDNQGGLKVTKTVSGNGDIEFTNYYKPAETSATISGTKTWYNQDLQQMITLEGNEFTFELYASVAGFGTQGNLIATTRNTSSGGFSFTIPYTQASDNFYILRESIEDAQGVSYDAGRYFIRVLVSDDGQGKLHPAVTLVKEGVGDVDAIVFDNQYTPDPTTAIISGTKALTGRDRDLVSGEFTFELYDAEGNLLQTAANIGTGFAFDAITYEKSGIYTYTVKEMIPDKTGVYKGVTYDTTAYTVTVEVIDNGKGSMVAGTPVITKDGQTVNEMLFQNSYDGADTYFSVAGKKSLNGKTLAAGMFTFELYDKNGVRIATATNDANGAFAFQDIPLAAAGNYEFTIVEQAPKGAEEDRKLNGIYYAEDKYFIEVKVRDNNAGELEVYDLVVKNELGQIVDHEKGEMQFVNSYTVEPVSVPIQVSKRLTGRTMKAGEFTFVIDDGDGYVEQATNGPTGIVAFSPITFYAAGERTFTVTEIKGTVGGVSYDDNSYRITVTATDNGDGTLSTEVTYPDGRPVFVNTYAVSGETSFDVSGTKTMEGRTMTQEDVFTFEMKDASGNVKATTQNQGGQFLFDDVTLNALGEHIFTITEQAPAGGVKDGITYSTQVYTVTVNVTDDGEGGMKASAPVITYQGVDVTSADFVNTYSSASAPLDLKAEKSYEKGFAQDVFTFLLTGHGENQKKTNDEYGDVVFDTVYLDKTGAYTFTITEENSGLAWVSYDDTEYKVMLEVKDDGKGQLYVDPATITYTADGDPATKLIFDNDYLLTPNTVTIGGEKVVTEDGIQKTLEGKEFTFGLYEGDQLLQTKSNIAGGSFTFDTIEYKKAGDHIYTVKEIIPDDREEGMIYDETVYTVKVSVTDNDKGSLLVSKELVGAETIRFTNTLHDIIVKDVAASNAPDVKIDGQKVEDNEILIYTITYTNTTGKDVTATITDILPEYTEFVSASDNGVCTDGTVTWNLAVAKNTTEKVSVTVRVAAPQKILVNDATVYDGTNTYTSNEVYNHTVEDVLVKDVHNSQGISIDGEQVKPGDELTYVIDYFNATAEEVTVTITDKLPAHTTFKSADASGSYNGTDTVQWTLKLAPWSTAEVSFKVTVNEPDVFIDNTATALVGTNHIESNTVTNHTFEEVGGKDVAKVTEPSVSIDGKAVKVGDILEYTISYTNITEVPVDVTITDEIPAYTKLLSVQGGTEKDGVITWTLNDVQPRQEVKVTFRVLVVGAGVVIENQAQIFDGTNKLTNTVTNSVPKKSVDKQTASTGEILTYTIDYINTTGKAADVVITDKLDAALAYVEGTAGTGVYADGVITWNIQDVPAGQRISVTFQAKIKANADNTSISNVAEVIENEIKIASTNETEVQVKKPALSILKEQAVGNGAATVKQQPVKAGDVVTYTITVTNTGEGDAYGITVSDKLPEGLGYVAGSANEGGKAENGILSWTLDSLASGQSVKLTFRVTVPKVDKDTTWKNVAAVVYENDPNGDKPTESGGVEIELKIPATPQTGDSFSAVLFIGLMVLSSFGLAAVIICKKREEEAQTQQ